MNDLTSKKCAPCEGGVEPLTRAQSESLMKQLKPDWKLADDGKSIASEWKFRNFFHTMSFVNAVAHIANAEDHHPDVELGYGSCRIRYNTHAINGLSENDFICAAKIDALPRT
jgi:4a-hydroxytetrahydrobiopterin dehydratase